jgi:hypothetical protein
MGIIGVAIGILFIFFLGKAILETIWGSICLIWGLFLHAVALVLDGLGSVIRAHRKLKLTANWGRLFLDFGIPCRNFKRFKRHSQMCLARITLILGYAVILIGTASIITAAVMIGMGQNPMKLAEQMPVPNVGWDTALAWVENLKNQITP